MRVPFPGVPGHHRPPGVPSVAVLVELARGPTAGGHIKCWERFAEAAVALGAGETGIDLTVYVLGDRPGVERWSPRVRFVTLRPVLSTAPLARRVGGADATDLAPYHPTLAGLLPRHDVWHLTHVFAFATTAVRLAGRARPARRAPRTGGGAPDGTRPRLVGSVHTDVPALTSSYLRQLTAPLPPAKPRRRPDGWSPRELAAAVVRRRRDRLLRACDRVLVATPSQRAEIARVVGHDHVSLLRRGVDRRRFRPDDAARPALRHALGIPDRVVTVLFVGRMDASKRTLMLAEAVRLLCAHGHAVHLVAVGSGPDSGRVTALLGPAATLLDPVPQQELARVYAGCDVFAFPSHSETIGNVVAEAMACGLPVVLPAGARTTGWLAAPGRDGLVVADDRPEGWARALARLVDDPAYRHALGREAGATARHRHPSWERVLTEDLLPLWRPAPHRPHRHRVPEP